MHFHDRTVEWACSLPQLAQGKHLKVSNGIHCHEVVEPLGVVASVVPFNFPIMVPLWTVPIALTMGNCVILKPSEKTPFTMARCAQLFHEAGVPPGVFQVVHGAVDAVLGLCDHPRVEALTFVGSSRVAKLVAARCHGHHKRVLALGGAKNHLVAVPDCDVDMASSDITSSFAGCAGQRCMAASALVTVGEQRALLDAVVAKAGALAPGQAAGKTVGPVVDKASHARILSYIDAAAAEGSGAKILLDGRAWARPSAELLARFPHLKEGNWVGPTVILHANRADPALHDEIFGPVLSVVVARDNEDAVAIENASPYGNAAAVYTQSGGTAEWFTARFTAGMIGVNIGIPVPREPFSFGGMFGTSSKYGDFDITGDGAMRFFSRKRKITTKWSRFAAAAPGSGAAAPAEGMGEDAAQFK